MKRRTTLIVGLIFLVLVAVFASAVKFVLPGVLKKEILDGVKDGCTDCVLAIKSINVSLSHPGQLVFHDVRFVEGQGGRSLVEARVKDLTVDVALLRSSREKLIFDAVEGDGVEVIYSDGDAPKIEEKAQPPGKELFFEVQRTKLNHALFRYVHTKKKTTAILHIQDIDGEMGAVGNTPEVLAKMATAKLSGRIEKSGRGELTLAALLRPGPWYVDVVLELTEQNIGDLNAYLTPIDGIELKGLVHKAVAKLSTRSETTKSNVQLVYQDADYKENPTPERGAIEAWLSNIGAQLVMTKSNVDRLPQDQQAEIEVKRDPDEPLVHYLIRSAKLGLLEVVKKPDSRRKQ